MRYQHKIIIAGPVGAGKTTAVGSLSDVPPIMTEADASDMTGQRKAKTTVAMDYGRLNLDGGECVHIYGSPGQERFDFMWEILSKGSIGLILLINNNRPTPMQDLAFFISSFTQLIKDTQFVVGITHSDERLQPSVTDYQASLQEMGWNVPVFEVDARNKEDMRMLLKALLFSLAPGLMETTDGS